MHYYPSEASVKYTNSDGDTITEGTCMRQAYFRCVGIEGAPYKPDTQYIFKLGSAVEYMIVEIWKQMGVWETNSVRWYDETHNLSGEVDAILKEPDGPLYGVEVKSFYGYFSEKYILGSQGNPGSPEMEAMADLTYYVIAISIVILAIIVTAVTYIIIKYRKSAMS